MYDTELDILEEEMTVGPKGQMVIPRAMRKALRIQPGSIVLFKLESNRAVVEKQAVDSVRVFEDVARRGRSVRHVSPHEYELELAKRA